MAIRLSSFDRLTLIRLCLACDVEAEDEDLLAEADEGSDCCTGALPLSASFAGAGEETLSAELSTMLLITSYVSMLACSFSKLIALSTSFCEDSARKNPFSTIDSAVSGFVSTSFGKNSKARSES